MPNARPNHSPATRAGETIAKAPTPKRAVKRQVLPSANDYLDALIPTKTGQQEVDGLRLLDRTLISTGAQPRRSFPAREIAELAASIRELRAKNQGVAGTGILQPLVVTPQESEEETGVQSGGGFRLVFGERRLRAAEAAGLEAVPAIVLQASGNVALMQLIENLQRRDLPPLEEAAFLANVMQEQKLSVRELAQRLGKNKGYVENRLFLLRAGSDVQAMVSARTDTLRHARTIQKVENPQQRRAFIEAAKQGASRRDLETRLAAHGQPKAPSQNKDRVRAHQEPEPTQEPLDTADSVALLEAAHNELHRLAALLPTSPKALAAPQRDALFAMCQKLRAALDVAQAQLAAANSQPH